MNLHLYYLCSSNMHFKGCTEKTAWDLLIIPPCGCFLFFFFIIINRAAVATPSTSSLPVCPMDNFPKVKLLAQRFVCFSGFRGFWPHCPRRLCWLALPWCNIEVWYSHSLIYTGCHLSPKISLMGKVRIASGCLSLHFFIHAEYPLQSYCSLLWLSCSSPFPFFFFPLLLVCLSFFLLMFRSSLYMKDMNPLPVLSIENIPVPHSAFRWARFK